MALEYQLLTHYYYENPKKKLMDSLKTEHQKLNMHVNGIGVDEYLKQLEGYENTQQHKARKQLAKSNKSTFASISRPIDKIFSAKGGSIVYDLPDSKHEDFRGKLNNANGISVKDFLKYYWRNRLWTDPNGIILIENTAKQAYPTYKSILTIREYDFTGQDLNYIIFEPVEVRKGNDVTKYVRVIDDKYDYTYIDKDSKLTLVEDKTYKNLYGKVPGFIISSIVSPVTNYKDSPVEELVEVADDLLIESSVYAIFKKLHGYPVFWRYLDPCPYCNGRGLLEGKQCPHCNGTGKNIKKDITDVIGLTYPENGEEKISPDVAGYVAPPVDTWTIMREEIEWMKSIMDHAHWGSNRVAQGVERTATETLFVNIQPVNERLNEYSDQLESAWKRIIDLLGKFYYGSLYKGCSVNVGRRFYFESPDQIFKKYTEAKTQGVNEVTLNYFLKQFYQTEFQNDEPAQVEMMKMLAIEPFPHNTKAEIQGLQINAIDYYAKVYFPEWLKTIKTEYLIKTDTAKLIDELYVYAQNKLSQTKIKDNDTE